jgi:hypothetical protein
MPLAGQLAHESCVRPGPLVLGTAFLKSPTAATDRDRHFVTAAPPCEEWGPGHFCLALHIAMQVGPYLHRTSPVFGVWSLRILDRRIQSFLLIDRTGQIVTARGHTVFRVCDTYEYCRILGYSSIWPNLKTARFIHCLTTF